MRFHHSTRRGRNRFGQGGNSTPQTGGKFGHPNHSISSRWAQLSYCRQTNIHFNSRLPVDLPDEMRHKALAGSELNLRHQSSGADQLVKDEQLARGPAERSFQNGRPHSNKHNNHHHHHHQHNRQLNEDHHLNQFDKLSLADERCDEQFERQPNTMTITRTATVRRSFRERKQHEQADQLAKSSVAHKGRDRQHSSEGESSQPTGSKSSDKDKTPPEDSRWKQTLDVRPKFDLEAAREKLVAQVDKHPFWSTKAAKRMRLLDLQQRQVYIYELTSYCERRDLEWRYEAYRGAKSGTSSSLFGGVQARRFQQPPQAQTHSSQPQSPLATSGGEFVTDTETANSLGKPTPPPPTPASAGLTNPNQSQTGRHQFVFEPAPVATANQVERVSSNSSLRQANLLQRQASSSSTAAIGVNAGSSGNRLRRSCSSATSSPVRTSPGQPLACSGSNPLDRTPVTSSSFVDLDQTRAAGDSRPMPSAEFVWSIKPAEMAAVARPAPFTCYLHTSEVPGTSFVKRCHGCQGRGRLKCASCYGVGYEVCLSCTGRGSLRSYSALSAGGGLGRASAAGRSGGRDSGGQEQSSRNRSNGGVTGGGMWDNASTGRLGGGGSDSTGGGAGGQDETSAGLSSQVCANCSGAGQKRCWICAGRSYITCTACAGTGSLRCFLNLNITYLNHRDEVCLNNADGLIPRDRLKLSSGLLLADETADQLSPLTGSSHTGQRQPPDGTSEPGQKPTNHQQDGAAGEHANQHHHELPSPPPTPPPLEQFARPGELVQLGSLSAKLLDKHWQAYKHERLIRQRHRVTQIECFKVDWEFRKKRGHFVVYGDERKVYIAKYPFKSICNIT